LANVSGTDGERAGSGGDAPAGEGSSGSKRAQDEDRLLVDEGGHRRPFMRGIMIHSLMARGVPFDEANRAANTVRDRLRPRGVVSKAEILEEVRGLLGDAPFRSDPQLPLPLDITIHGKGRGDPFSKGVLSQSLLAAAIDPHDAFDVARQIERELLRRGVREIDRSELRKLAYETLARRFDAETAERYLVWRQYQDPERPVMLLLGGAAGVGKTKIGLEVAHRLGIGRVLSSDSIRQIMRLTLSQEIAPALHASSYEAYKLVPEDMLGDEPVIDGFRAQTAIVSVGVRASMDRALAENASMVIDGVAVVPGLIDPDAYAGQAEVIFLLVATLDPDAYKNRFAARAEDEQRRPAHRYLEHLEAILQIQDHLLEMAEKHGIPIVDNDSFERAVLLVIRHVTETLRKRGSMHAAPTG
jgi:2-phosphoglycerate kinase